MNWSKSQSIQEAVAAAVAHPHPISFRGTLYGASLGQRLCSAWRRSGWVFSPNVLLIHGPEGCGKSLLAAHLVGEVLAADQSLVASLSHPDLVFCSAQYEINSFTEKKPGMPQILVDEIREIDRFLSLGPGLSRHRVIVIDHAEYLNLNAANALLKLLEGCSADTLVIFTTSNLRRLPMTLLSRCAKWRQPLLSRDDFFAALRQRMAATVGDMDSAAVGGGVVGAAEGRALDLYKVSDANLRLAVNLLNSGIWQRALDGDSLMAVTIELAEAIVAAASDPGVEMRLMQNLSGLLLHLWHKSTLLENGEDGGDGVERGGGQGQGAAIAAYLKWRRLLMEGGLDPSHNAVAAASALLAGLGCR